MDRQPSEPHDRPDAAVRARLVSSRSPSASAGLATGRSSSRADFARMAFLEAIGEALSYLLDREEVLLELARRAVPEMADYCVTYLTDPETREIRRVGVAHANSSHERLLHRLTEVAAPTPSDLYGVGAVVRTGEPMLTSDVPDEMIDALPEIGGYRDMIRALAPVSSMILPLRARGQTVGALTLATTSDSDLHYGPDDLTFATAVARRAAVALDNARLYGESRIQLARRQQAEEALRGRFEQLRSVYQMAQAVATAAAPEAIYQEALRALEQGVGADRAAILLFGDDRVMRFRAWSKLSERYRRRVEGHSPWAPDDLDPHPIVIADVASAELDADLRATVLDEGIRSLTFVPLVFRRRLLGKFMLYFDRPHHPAREEIDLAEAIARTIAFAITRVADEQSVRSARDAAERASQAKSQFLGVMSHELRTPLNSVVGYSDLLLMETKGPLNEAQREFVRRIQASAQHQLGLIEELLTYTRLEAGRGEVRLMTTDVGRIVTDVLELVRPEAERKGIALAHELPEAPLHTVTDPARVRQIVLNLVGNAAKFTDEGEVRVRASLGAGHVDIEVHDTGPGIPEGELDRIWEPFVQIEADSPRKRGGTGLGLSIARGLAELLDGKVSATSVVGRGSTFTLRLPHRPEDTAPAV